MKYQNTQTLKYPKVIPSYNPQSLLREEYFWNGATMPVTGELREEPDNQKPYDLEERTAQNRVGTCKKEAKETKFFLRMVAVAEEQLKSEARVLWQEAKELHLIFCTIYAK